jgi:murein peptide amidase A
MRRARANRHAHPGATGRCRARPLSLAAILAGAAALAILAQHLGPAPSRPRSAFGSSRSGRRAASKPVPDPVVKRRVLLGRSVRGRSIYAIQIGDPDNEQRTLVVGVIHGNEPAGASIATDLASRRPSPERLLWVIKALNPDGVAAGTRQNADRVDLNRNFPWRWRSLGRPGDLTYSGPRPLSEPESRIAQTLILRLRPQTTIWFHQPLGLVDESGGSIAVERRFARVSGLPLRRLTRYPGSAAGWQNHRLPGTTAFVVELPPGPLSARSVARYARAVLRTG